MKPQAAAVWRALAVLVLVGAAAAWLLVRTEWVDQPVPQPLAGALRQDGSLTARLALQRLGLSASRADNLITLPPPGATLVLSSRHWEVIDGSSQRLQDWVLSGGHLVIDGAVLPSIEGQDWFPMEQVDDQTPRNHHDCRVLKPSPGAAAVFGSDAGFVACLLAGKPLRRQQRALWALENEDHGVEAQRLPLGRGRVTAFSGYFAFEHQAVSADPARPHLRNLSNRGLVEGDNLALLAALVDARPGAEVWFVSLLDREPLPLWLWQRAAPALLLAALALMLALWRGGSRFGPLQADPPAARRSLAAQISGNADFLFRHQPAALQTMALRALDECAAGRIAAWRRLSAAERPTALARATGLPETALAAALDTGVPRRGAAAANTLALLETARRALQARPRSTSQRPTP